ncbi:MAG: hypothetical protein OXI37_07965, partial [Gammaproteobacteria bacterium]|nr:hypothetical protein [Gammaproteobacteria bacterium]
MHGIHDLVNRYLSVATGKDSVIVNFIVFQDCNFIPCPEISMHFNCVNSHCHPSQGFSKGIMMNGFIVPVSCDMMYQPYLQVGGATHG